jgi:hypothetical protein
MTTDTTHVDYPHEAGRLHDCPACEAHCHCYGQNPASVTPCVFTGAHVWSITRRNGIAGAFTITALVSYDLDRGDEEEGEEDDAPEYVTFHGSTYGGPVVMSTPSYPDGVFVSAAVLDRIGHTLTESWVRAFFGGAR